MNRVMLSGRHEPCIREEVVGCDGYAYKFDCLYCLIVSESRRHVNDGIVENSIIYVDSSIPYEKDRLNIFVNDMGEFELSASRENDKDYSGRVIMTINQYD